MTNKKQTYKLLYTENSDGTICITGLKGKVNQNLFEESIKIPQTINGKKVTSIGCNAFSNNLDLVAVDLPVGITAIEENAFCGCENLKKISSPSALESIGKFAFSNCKSLTTMLPAYDIETYHGDFGVVLSPRLNEIGAYAFADCTSLSYVKFQFKFDNKELTEENKIKTIPDGCFRNCKKLEVIKLPKKLAEIKNYAFENCSSLQSITIPNYVNKIALHAFDNCSAKIIDGNTKVADFRNYKAYDNRFEKVKPKKVTISRRQIKNKANDISKSNPKVKQVSKSKGMEI